VSIVLNWDFAFFNPSYVSAFIVDDSLLTSKIPVTAYNETTTGTSNTNTVATLAGGFIIAGAFVGGASAGPTVTSSTAGLSTDAFVNGQAYMSAHANGVAANGASSVTMGWSTSSGNAGLALAAYR
jgi:hypothetical protein